MIARACLICGTVSTSGSRCPAHETKRRKRNAAARGYDATWTKLSRRARKLQPWCTDCGATTDLQADHLPSAWERRAAGQPIRLGVDLEVCCGDCNRRRGAARGPQTRGETPNDGLKDPRPQAKFPTLTGFR